MMHQINEPFRQVSHMTEAISIAPTGEAFPLPKPEDYEKEFQRLKKLVAQFRGKPGKGKPEKCGGGGLTQFRQKLVSCPQISC